MPSRFVKINPMLSQKWWNFIHEHPDITIFHHPNWMLLLNKQYGYTPKAYGIKNDDGELTAGQPLMKVNGGKLTSLPFTDYCNPLYKTQEDLEELIDNISKIQKEQNIEIRWSIPKHNGFTQTADCVLHTINLDNDPQKIFNNFKHSHRKNIKKALRENLDVEIDITKDGIEKFYKIHTKNRQRLGVPVQPKRFFRLLWKYLINENLGFVLLVYKSGNPIAGGVFLHYNRILTAKYSGADPEYLSLRPMNLIFWWAIQWGCHNGYKTFDFGKTQLANTGLRRFKDGWGTVEKPLKYYTLNKQSSNTEKTIESDLMEKTMDFLSQKTIQSTPIFVCRLTGELLYKYFG
ncbi:GNAT family N-acetyltransferase [Candidatus Poribacteria bacterium]|nr:GNAT family N-acetyltransferase [Candidatus Poribacteria bacterium]